MKQNGAQQHIPLSSFMSLLQVIIKANKCKTTSLEKGEDNESTAPVQVNSLQ